MRTSRILVKTVKLTGTVLVLVLMPHCYVDWYYCATKREGSEGVFGTALSGL